MLDCTRLPLDDRNNVFYFLSTLHVPVFTRNPIGPVYIVDNANWKETDCTRVRFYRCERHTNRFRLPICKSVRDAGDVSLYDFTRVESSVAKLVESATFGEKF